MARTFLKAGFIDFYVYEYLLACTYADHTHVVATEARGGRASDSLDWLQVVLSPDSLQGQPVPLTIKPSLQSSNQTLNLTCNQLLILFYV